MNSCEDYRSFYRDAPSLTSCEGSFLKYSFLILQLQIQDKLALLLQPLLQMPRYKLVANSLLIETAAYDEQCTVVRVTEIRILR